ncbi:ABC transporter substrate-binding protein, partial [Salipiger sp. HF18]|nr:ABC transporter substrate-binding protein [Salipiger sp. HF18]
MIRLLALLLTVATGVTLAPPLSAQEDRARIGNGNTVLELRSTTDVAIIRPALEAFVEQNPQ